MSAEEIARVVAEVRAGRYRIPPYGTDLDKHLGQMTALSGDVLADTASGPIVDATALYHSLTETGREVALYEDHPNIAPPWEHSTICYRNEHGNVFLMVQGGYEADRVKDDPDWHDVIGTRWETPNPIEWDRVRWLVDSVLWIGGRGGRGPITPTGPLYMWRFAVYEDGAPADLHWLRLCDRYSMETNNAHLVLLGTLNFMNCRNVELVEPHRPRPEAKRIARTGLRISELNIWPVGRSRRSGPTRTHGVPLTTVRGHFAHYGACCAHHEPRGLLFGKLSGRYFVPQHARGSVEHGEIEQRVTLHPEES